MSQKEEALNQRLLQMLNRAKRADEVAALVRRSNNRIGGDLRPKTVEGLMSRRNELPDHVFRDMKQVEELTDFSPQELQNMRDVLDVSAAEFFQEQMAEEVLPGNWQLDSFSATFPNSEAFDETVETRCRFVDFVAKQVVQFGTERFGNSTAAELAGELLKRSYVEHFKDPHYGAYAFAFWFYQFDADNWFAFDQVREVTEQYLNFYPNWEERLELYLFKGFDNAGVLANAVTHADLPVVVNYGEQAVTIWTSQLND